MSRRFKSGTTCKRKYPRVTAGPLRDKYIHRIVAAALLGRDLTKDEEVHHKDGDRRNFDWKNLMVLGQRDHGWVSSKQAWYMREQDILKKVEWDEYMETEYKRFDVEVAIAKAEGVPYNVEDGGMQRRYEGVA